MGTEIWHCFKDRALLTRQSLPWQRRRRHRTDDTPSALPPRKTWFWHGIFDSATPKTALKVSRIICLSKACLFMHSSTVFFAIVVIFVHLGVMRLLFWPIPKSCILPVAASLAIFLARSRCTFNSPPFLPFLKSFSFHFIVRCYAVAMVNSLENRQ